MLDSSSPEAFFFVVEVGCLLLRGSMEQPQMATLLPIMLFTESSELQYPRGPCQIGALEGHTCLATPTPLLSSPCIFKRRIP